MKWKSADDAPGWWSPSGKTCLASRCWTGSLWLLGYLCWGGLLVSLAALASATAVVVPSACVLLLSPQCFREVAAGVHQCGTVLAAARGTPVTRVVLEGRMCLST